MTNTLTDANLQLIQFPGNESTSNKVAAFPRNSLTTDPDTAPRPSMSYLDFLMWMSGLVLLGVIIVSIMSSISIRRSNRSASAALRRVQSDGQSRTLRQEHPPASDNPSIPSTSLRTTPENAGAPQPSAGNPPVFHHDAILTPPVLSSSTLPEAFPDMTIHRRIPYQEPTFHSGTVDSGQSQANPAGISSEERNQLNRAIWLSRENRGDDALSIIQDVEGRFPDHAEVYLAKGVVFQHLLQWDQAIHAFDRSIQHNPSMPNAYLRKARLLERMQFVHESRACYRQALDLVM